MPENVKVLAPFGGTPGFKFDMKKHKNIDPEKPGEWRFEQELQQRLAAQPGHSTEPYANISDTLEQCISSNAHVLGFAVTYHDYQTHNSYYGKRKKCTAKAHLPGLD